MPPLNRMSASIVFLAAFSFLASPLAVLKAFLASA